MLQDTLLPLSFPAVGRKKVSAAFDGGRMTSDGGVMLLGAVERRMGLARRPEVCVSDMLGSQRGHGVLWQVCLAHLLRYAKYAVECGDTAFSTPFRRPLLRAMAIGR